MKSSHKTELVIVRYRQMLIVALTIAGLAGTTLAQQSDPPNNIFAQTLVDEFTAKYVRVITIGLHAKLPNSSEYQIIAHSLKDRPGRKSTPADLEVIRTGRPDGPNGVGGGVFDVALPLYDRSGATIGAVVIHVKPGKGDPKVETLKLASRVRDEISKQISSEAKLFERVN
jgi:hypothetical protein